VEEEAGVDDIARLMEKHQIRRVPVLRDGKLVGIVSRADLLRAVLAPAAPAAEGKATDATLLQSVLAAMREQPWVDTFYVFPSVKDGVVSLYGFHRSEAVQRGLVLLAQDVPGVKSVDDRTEPMPFFLRASL
jgi:Mg/Co/Ni transporter MgtE